MVYWSEVWNPLRSRLANAQVGSVKKMRPILAITPEFYPTPTIESLFTILGVNLLPEVVPVLETHSFVKVVCLASIVGVTSVIGAILSSLVLIAPLVFICWDVGLQMLRRAAGRPFTAADFFRGTALFIDSSFDFFFGPEDKIVQEFALRHRRTGQFSNRRRGSVRLLDVEFQVRMQVKRQADHVCNHRWLKILHFTANNRIGQPFDVAKELIAHGCFGLGISGKVTEGPVESGNYR